MRKRRFQNIPALCLALLVMNLFLGGSFLKPKEMTLDTRQNIVYQHESMEYFLIRKANTDLAKKTYHNNYYMFLGMVISKAVDGKSIQLGLLNGSSRDMLQCNGNSAEVIDSISELQGGDKVKVYGKLTLSFGEWNLQIDRIEKTEETTVSRTAYSTINGTTVDTEKMVERSLNKGKVKLLIPTEWTAVEKDLVMTGLGAMEGYQYCLNEINEQSVQPESLFVCYFDNEKHLLRSSDKSETELIERAIVKNILKKDPGAAISKKQSYYGTFYHYYQETYQTALGQNYHAEFVFQPDGTKGMVVYLYVYREKAHLDEAMLVMRLLSVN